MFHTYLLCATGMHFHGRAYASRESATEAMYHIMARHDLSLEKVYDDKHDKTYVCTNGVRFYISRQY